MNFTHMIWRLQRLAHILGFWGLCGVLLCLCALVLGARATQLNQTIAQKQADLSAAKLLTNARKPPIVEDARNDTSKIHAFYQHFPPASQLTQSQARLYAIAASHKLKLPEGDYKLRLNKRNTDALDEYELTLPLSGSYAQLRSFVDDALLEMPELALVQMELSRDNVAQSAIHAHMVWVLFAGQDT